jgi:hypothetical protein
MYIYSWRTWLRVEDTAPHIFTLLMQHPFRVVYERIFETSDRTVTFLWVPSGTRTSCSG